MNVAGMVTQPSPSPSDDLAISKYTDDMIESSMIQNNVSVKKEVICSLNNYSIENCYYSMSESRPLKFKTITFIKLVLRLHEVHTVVDYDFELDVS